MVKRNVAWDWNQFHFVEVRIGNTDMTGTGNTQMMENHVAGNSGAASSPSEYVYVVEPPLDGRYLTLQNVEGVNYLSVDEIYMQWR